MQYHAYEDRESQRVGDPIVAGPVDPGYRLGPGDEVQLVLTGDVEDAYALTVSREGYIFIPAVGQVSVNGLTLGQLEDQLFSRLSRVYSGVSRSVEATTRFQISLGRLRVNQVFVMGDVARPNAYQVSAAATVSRTRDFVRTKRSPFRPWQGELGKLTPDLRPPEPNNGGNS